MSTAQNRVALFEVVLQGDTIDKEEIYRLCFSGIPEEKGLRPFCWKILLNYMPLVANERDKTLETRRSVYKGLIEEFIVAKPGGGSDHPLNDSPSSSWGTYFKDNEVLTQIDKDVRRLYPDMAFFQMPTQFPCDVIVNSKVVNLRLHKRIERKLLPYGDLETQSTGFKKICYKNVQTEDSSSGYQPMPEGSEAHWEVIERILFIYAKLNPGQSYVQGMNEIVGPIYHTFATDPNLEHREFAEADCFFCFTNLMSEIRDFYIRSLDESDSGINQLMERLDITLKKHDDELWKKMKELDIKPQYYSFRWLTLLLSQEFPLPEVERLWDSMFADVKRFSFLVDICCAMLILVKDVILNGDFATVVKLLQHYPPMDIGIILSKAYQLSLV